jgi:hypothetical protein
MPEGTGLDLFRKEFPTRFYDVGLGEQHAVTFAAGMACGGLKPVVAIYSTFLQRGFDQMFHDVALQKLPVVFCLDRAGLVGEDGPTHHGAYDLSYSRMFPNMTVMAPPVWLENPSRDGARFAVVEAHGYATATEIGFHFRPLRRVDAVGNDANACSAREGKKDGAGGADPAGPAGKVKVGNQGLRRRVHRYSITTFENRATKINTGIAFFSRCRR